jgi:hypothetical protein
MKTRLLQIPIVAAANFYDACSLLEETSAPGKFESDLRKGESVTN